MVARKRASKKLSAGKEQVMSMDVPIHNCTLGYPNTVKMTIAGQTVEIHGPMTITAADDADPELRVKVRWTPPRDE